MQRGKGAYYVLLAAYSKMQGERDKLKERLLNKRNKDFLLEISQLLQMTNKTLIKKWFPGRDEIQDITRKTWPYDNIKGVFINPLLKPHIDLICCLMEKDE